MSKALRSIPALGAVFFALVGVTGCGGGGVPGNAVASVNGTSITTDAFNHWMKVAANASRTSVTAKVVVPDPPNYTACIAHERELETAAKAKTKASEATLKTQCKTQYKSLLQEVLGFLITSQWVLSEANALGVKLSDKEVHKQFEKILATQFPSKVEFEKFVSNSGETVSDLLLRVKLNQLSSKIQQKVVKEKSTVTSAEIEKFYNENKSRFGAPEKRSVAIILTKTEAQAKSAKKEVESGKSFASVAKKVSIDPTSKANGGLLGEVVKGEEEKPLGEDIFAAPSGKLSGVVKTAFGYYVFEVHSVTKGTQQTLAQAKATIKQEMMATKQQEALSKFVKSFKKRWLAKTDCASEFIVTDCKQYKAPKTSSPSTATAE